MTAIRIEFFDYVEQLRCAALDVHSTGRATIDEWLAEMNEAAARDDAETVARLARYIKAKIEQEQEWEREHKEWCREHGVDVDDEPDKTAIQQW